MAAPQVPIEVDPETGVWTTDGLPMLYVPRHFLVNNHSAVEAALGAAAYGKLLYDAGYKSAYAWCEQECATHGLTGMDVFHHYMRRLSQRGWGQFDGSGIDPTRGCGTVTLRHSCFVYHYGANAGRKVCYMCAGWFPGALDWVGRNTGAQWSLTAREAVCAAEGHDHCRFEVVPA
jgi:predicted hydrocarbon binding protein